MLERILRISLERRGLVVVATIALAAYGGYCLVGLPIDAVPDITNRQVQINVTASSLSPLEVEKQVTFPIETALAGIPGLDYTRSFSRNGFAQVTAVFGDDVDIYFARQQVAERLAMARADLPDDAEPALGPISTGLGEIYMWTVEFEHPGGRGAATADGRPGWQTRRLLPDARGRAPHDRGRARGISAHGAGLDHPPADRSASKASPASTRSAATSSSTTSSPTHACSPRYGLGFHDLVDGPRAQQRRAPAPATSSTTARLSSFAPTAAYAATRRDREHRRRRARRRADSRARRRRPSASAASCAPAAPARTARRSWSARRMMLIGANSRTVARAVDGEDGRDRTQPSARRARKDGARPHPPRRRDDRHRENEPRRGRGARHRRAVRPARKPARRPHHRAGDPALDAADGDRHGADAAPAAI